MINFSGSQFGRRVRFSCDACPKSYTDRSNLNRHKKYECGDKEPVFRCPFCPYKGKQKVSVKKHAFCKHGAFL